MTTCSAAPQRVAPRLVLTQTIAPATARRAAENFSHLRGLGSALNLLPGYYIPWKDAQLADLKTGRRPSLPHSTGRPGQRESRSTCATSSPGRPRPSSTPAWSWTPTADPPQQYRPVGALDESRSATVCGDLDHPPEPAALAAKAQEINGLLERTVAPLAWQSTQAVDAALTAMVQGLYPDRAAAAGAPPALSG